MKNYNFKTVENMPISNHLITPLKLNQLNERVARKRAHKQSRVNYDVTTNKPRFG